jgi:hypothetical protein
VVSESCGLENAPPHVRFAHGLAHERARLERQLIEGARSLLRRDSFELNPALTGRERHDFHPLLPYASCRLGWREAGLPTLRERCIPRPLHRGRLGRYDRGAPHHETVIGFYESGKRQPVEPALEAESADAEPHVHEYLPIASCGLAVRTAVTLYTSAPLDPTFAQVPSCLQPRSPLWQPRSPPGRCKTSVAWSQRADSISGRAHGLEAAEFGNFGMNASAQKHNQLREAQLLRQEC